MGNIVTVNFRNDTLFAVEQDDGIFVAITPICQSLGLVAQKQRERIQRDPILGEGVTTMVTPSPGGFQETYCLRLDLVHGWLFTIDESRVKDEETRQKVLAYKRECYRVLFQHFFGKGTKRGQVEGDEPQESESVKLKMVNEGRHVFGNQAAAQLWFQLGLPVVPAMLREQHEMFSYNAIRAAPEAPLKQGAA